MQTIIELQPRHEQRLARWKQLGADPELAKLPYKIETDRLGRILMSPSPFFAETPVVTTDGVKVTDASWISAG